MRNDQGAPSDKQSLVSLPSRLLAKLSSTAPAPSVVAGIDSADGAGAALLSARADHGSVAVGGANNGLLINAAPNAQVNVYVEHRVQRELPSYLSNVLVALSGDLMNYGAEAKRELRPEITEKLAYNDFPIRHQIIRDFTMYSGSLEAAYRGVEQRNGDARRMVRRRAGSIYQDALLNLCEVQGVHHSQAHVLAREHAALLVRIVIDALKSESAATSLTLGVMKETADLAISLIVADAIVECEVLERPDDASAA